MNKGTGILFFARTPEDEARVKNWTPSKKKNLALAQRLFDHSQRMIDESGLPFVHFDNQAQDGDNFNEKISNALSEFFELGFDNAIIVGSDCLDLAVEDVLSAHDNMTNDKMTIGQSADGGVYLFTIAKSQFDKEGLADLSWCTDRLSDQLFDNVYNGVSVDFLLVKVDFDSDLHAVEGWLKKLRSSALRWIQSLLSEVSCSSTVHFLSNRFFLQNLQFRGPPASIG